jgi:hypothetical protein
MGPWNLWLHFPHIGAPVCELTKALSSSPTLPKPVCEVAILVMGAHFSAGCEFMFLKTKVCFISMIYLI